MELFKKLALITPSRITGAQRFKFASESMLSLKSNLKDLKIHHIIIHDSPEIKSLIPIRFHNLLNPLRWDKKANSLYNEPHMTFINGKSQGSALAMLEGVNIAISSGKAFGFIHLDDHIYCKPFADLITYGLDAMDKNPNLLWTRFSGYPIIFNGEKPLLIQKEQITFDSVKLSPFKNENYTLWSSPINPEVNEGGYWPIAMWFCIYKLSVLKNILEWAIAAEKKHLGHVEVYYKENNGFDQVIDAYPTGSFGYINMQFGGFEMHRNANWEVLLSSPNDEIR